MNRTFLLIASFLIALLCHGVIFTLFTFVFPINPEAFKPKLFFLGPILQQSDVKQISSKQPTARVNNHSGEDPLPVIEHDTTDSEKNPFVIQTLNKPLTHQPGKSQEKVTIQSTFEASPEMDINQDEEIHRPDLELKIQPYRPLQFQPPKAKAAGPQ